MSWSRTMEQATGRRANAAWWKHPLDEWTELYRLVVGHVDALHVVWADERWRDLLHEKIYLNEPIARGQFGRAQQMLQAQGFTAARLNVTRSKVDTLAAKVAKRPPAVRITPDGAKWSLKRQSRELRKFLFGLFEQNDHKELGPRIFRDSAIVNTGVIKACPRFGRVEFQRVRRRELYVDPFDARDGDPRQLHQRGFVAREVLEEMFKGQRHAESVIRRADRASRSDLESAGIERNLDADVVEFFESWHLPSSPKAKDGRHAICLRNGTLIYETWARPRFPFAFLRFDPPLNGFWGESSLVGQLAGIQHKINEILSDIQERMFFAGAPLWLVQRNANINFAHLSGRKPRIVEHDGVRPEQVTPEPIGNQVLQLLEFLLDQADVISGISQLSARAQNPLGANASGAALQEFEDIESERFYQVEAAYQRLWVDLSEVAIDTAKAMAEGDEKPAAVWSEGGIMRRVDWASVDMDRDAFTIQLEPANFLPDTRTGKLAAAERLGQAGIIRGDALASLFDYPDIQGVMRHLNAPRDYWLSIVEKLEDDEAPQPGLDPNTDIEMGLSLITGNYNQLLAEATAPTEVLRRHRMMIRVLEAAQERAALASMAQQGESPAQAPAAPSTPDALPPGPAPETLPGQAFPGQGAIQ